MARRGAAEPDEPERVGSAGRTRRPEGRRRVRFARDGYAPGWRLCRRRKPGKVHYGPSGKPQCGARHRHDLRVTGDPREVNCQRCRRWLESDKRQTSLFT